MKRKTLLTAILLVLLSIAPVSAQETPDFSALEYRSLGPTRGGRVTTVAGVASQPSVFYMGSTGGGVWKTTDYGTSWINVSDGYFATPSIGAIRVAPSDPNILYIGTGSDGLRSNVIAGKGVYKSIDAGQSWKHIGLDKTGQIGAVEVHPLNHNIAFVAAIGNAFADNPERGIFRTRDGGGTWEKVLYLSDSTGFSDLEFMPSNPDIIYATAWRAERKPWTIISGGQENGIYKSIDGGDTWKRTGKGLPDMMGKIDLAVSPADSRVLYALVEASWDETGLYRSNDQGETFEQVSNNHRLTERPFYYTNLDVDPKNVEMVYVMSTQFFKSTDGGKSWSRMRVPHGDNHDMWINPDNPDLFIQANDGGANVTFNGGKTWSTQLNQPTAEIYQVEVDEQYPYWLYGGQQDNYSTVSVPSLPPRSHQVGGLGLITNAGGCETGPAVPRPDDANVVYSNCKGNFSVYNKRTGQEQRYSVGAQYMYGHNPGDLIYRFQRVSPIHISPHNPDVVYHTSQYVHRTRDGGKNWETISPDLTAFEPDKQVISGSPFTRDITGEEFYSTIYSIRESRLQEGLIWVGANDGPVHVTQDGGVNWKKVTPSSLPKGGRIDSVEPSPHRTEKAYFTAMRYQLGDPKPYIYRTEDNGLNWTLITTGLPVDGPVRVVREDPDREGLLYAGTEDGLYVSFDDGDHWRPFQLNLPVTPVTDLKVHRKDLVLSTMGRGFWVLDDLSALHQGADLVADGDVRLFKPRDSYRYRYSIPSGVGLNYPPPSMILDYYLPESPEAATVELEIYDASGKPIRAFTSEDRGREDTSSRDMATNFQTYTTNPQLETKPGLHRFRWDMRHEGAWSENEQGAYRNGPYVAPGTYQARLRVGETVVEQEFELKADPRALESGVAQDDLVAQEELALKVVALLSDARRLAQDIQEQKAALSEEASVEHARLQALEAALVRAEGRYTQPMLIDQIGYLYGMLTRADQVPGQDVYQRYETLLAELADMKAKVLSNR